MVNRQPRRIERELTDEEQERLRRAREETERELPALIEQGRQLKDAANEPTLSGQLRRAVHASDLTIAQIADHVGITPIQLGEFLTGESPLPSDVLDQLAHMLGCELVQTH